MRRNMQPGQSKYPPAQMHHTVAYLLSISVRGFFSSSFRRRATKSVLDVHCSPKRYLFRTARRSGMCVKQIYEWLQQDHFRNELSKRRSEIFQAALSTLKSATSQAITTLVNILSEPDP